MDNLLPVTRERGERKGGERGEEEVERKRNEQPLNNEFTADTANKAII